MSSIVFIDSEISTEGGKILDLGAVKPDGSQLHTSSERAFSSFIAGADYICGHNIVAHDLKYIGGLTDRDSPPTPIDTLYLSPLLFPDRPYHALVKDDKLRTEELNNPLGDAIKAMRLFYDEINAFDALNGRQKWIYCGLLYPFPEFGGYFKFKGISRLPLTAAIVKAEFAGKLCANADIDTLIKNCPIELAYSLALISAGDYHSITPPWVLKNYPKTQDIMRRLRASPCEEGCAYCSASLDVSSALKRIFGYDSFRTYNGEPLQEMAARAAVRGRSLLAVFPTGGGKSITFQLPALMAGEAEHGLTIVLSPLQSLMKDQVDNLSERGIIDAVTINGMLSPIERAEAIQRVQSGVASILYISPEMLRSKTIERLLLSRNVSRFVIDEAHCFSAWGQDFRVDYLYIGEFIAGLQKTKNMENKIPISCFTATAKQKVISDIRDYFKRTLGLELDLFTTSAARENLRYAVMYKESDEEKYSALRSLVEQKKCPTIVYVSRTRRTRELAEKLSRDGFSARPFNGRMDSVEKIANQEAFIKNEVQVIVATSAFGMGVDKKDVGLVVHYDISDSLENYVQEAGRAGRNPNLSAECYVLFCDNDLDKHFILLNQTKLSIGEIQQVWKAVKDLTRRRESLCCSPLEIARQAGWDDSVSDIETRVKTAISALETAGYVKRGKNVPHVYATSIVVKSVQEAGALLDASPRYSETQRQNARRIIGSLISQKYVSRGQNDEAESRVDYLADTLGIEKAGVIEAVALMREDGLLNDWQDMSAYIHSSDSQNKSAQILGRFARLERFLLEQVDDAGSSFHPKELNGRALDEGISFSNLKNIKKILYYWGIKGYIQKSEYNSDRRLDIFPAMPVSEMRDRYELRMDICRFIVDELYDKSSAPLLGREDVPVHFSLLGLYKSYCKTPRLYGAAAKPKTADVEDALLYLSKIEALSLEGGFLVLYNGMEINRLIKDNKIRYKQNDYRMLGEFYKQKIQQIHIVGEFASLMVRDYKAALQFVQDYFQMDFKKFISTYFKGERAAEIGRNITPEKYRQLFGALSEIQTKIINDESRYIVVAAGPGSGKTRVLVHKLASLLLLEDVKHEQLLMLTFSRAAATDFKKRLIELIGNAAGFVEVKTFHSYCFDLLGRVGSLEGAQNVVREAAEMINEGEAELGRVTKTVLVIDEAQDMDEHEFALVEAMMRRNEEMRVIAVGDDDQNIYEFRGSDSKYLRSFVENHDAALYEMTENYRSRGGIVALANAFAGRISNRMKSAPGRAVQVESGVVRLVHCAGRHLEVPIAIHIAASAAGRSGTVCVLTTTNDEALRVLSLLLKIGLKADLLQSSNGFSLYNLAEVRFFLRCVDKELSSPVISDELFAAAKERLANVYHDSDCLAACMKMLSDFEAVNRTKYRTDLEEFIKESSYEDFYAGGRGVVLVSTIHKAKGREFDVVYLLAGRAAADTDEDRRRLYVGLTRAKRELHVYYGGGTFGGFPLPGVENIEDTREYPEPEELILLLSHRDVALGFFAGKKELVLRLHSGAELGLDREFLTAKINGRTVRVAKFSKACIGKIEELRRKGYEIYRAQVRFVVAWKGEEEKAESAVILPDLWGRRVEGGRELMGRRTVRPNYVATSLKMW